MQFRDFLSDIDNPALFNCTKCRGTHRKCLYNGEVTLEQIDYDGKGEKTWTLKTPEDAENYIEHVSGIIPDKMDGYWDELYILLNSKGSNVCPVPLFTGLSGELIRMHGYIQNGLYPYPGGYFEQLAIFVQASGIIGAEEAELHKKRMAKVNGR